MSSADIPIEVKHFIHDHISTLDQLEILLLLRGSPERVWSATEISTVLYTNVQSVKSRLEAFCLKGLLIKTEAVEPYYKYKPTTDLLAKTIDDMARVYKDRRVSVVAFIYGSTDKHLQAFSDAFILRKKEEK